LKLARKSDFWTREIDQINNSTASTNPVGQLINTDNYKKTSKIYLTYKLDSAKIAT